MDNNIIQKVITELNDSSNTDLVKALDLLEKDFYLTKENIVQLTKRLDATEELYNKILSEFKRRTGKS